MAEEKHEDISPKDLQTKAQHFLTEFDEKDHTQSRSGSPDPNLQKVYLLCSSVVSEGGEGPDVAKMRSARLRLISKIISVMQPILQALPMRGETRANEEVRLTETQQALLDRVSDSGELQRGLGYLAHDPESYAFKPTDVESQDVKKLFTKLSFEFGFLTQQFAHSPLPEDYEYELQLLDGTLVEATQLHTQYLNANNCAKRELVGRQYIALGEKVGCSEYASDQSKPDFTGLSKALTNVGMQLTLQGQLAAAITPQEKLAVARSVLDDVSVQDAKINDDSSSFAGILSNLRQALGPKAWLNGEVYAVNNSDLFIKVFEYILVLRLAHTGHVDQASYQTSADAVLQQFIKVACVGSTKYDGPFLKDLSRQLSAIGKLTPFRDSPQQREMGYYGDLLNNQQTASVIPLWQAAKIKFDTAHQGIVSETQQELNRIVGALLLANTQNNRQLDAERLFTHVVMHIQDPSTTREQHQELGKYVQDCCQKDPKAYACFFDGRNIKDIALATLLITIGLGLLGGGGYLVAHKATELATGELLKKVGMFMFLAAPAALSLGTAKRVLAEKEIPLTEVLDRPVAP